jgi:thiol-disulfide isomerase/thioredoxin
MLALITGFGSPPVASDIPEIKRVSPLDGELTWLLKEEVSKGHERGRKTITMMDATWCSSCKRFIALLKNPILQNALRRVTIITLDVDAWGQRAFKDGGFAFRKIPAFFRLKPSGFPNGSPISPASWSGTNAERAAEVFRKFLARDSNF